MSQSWTIAEEIEKPFREALNHASKRHVTDLHDMLAGLTEAQIAGAIGLCGFVAAYTAIDVVSRKWPSEEGLRLIANRVVTGNEADEQFGVTKENLYLYLSQCALGFKSYSDVFGDVFTDPHELLSAPFFFTINLVAKAVPEGTSVGAFLDQIEDAYEKAWLLDLNLLPALMVRSRMPQPEQGSGGPQG